MMAASSFPRPIRSMQPSLSAVNAHQRTDKGFGPALGPSAAAAAISRFEALGYSVVQGNSDWVIGTADQEIQIELLGWMGRRRE